MASSGNFCTLNPSTAAYADLKDGNVRVTGLSASGNGYFQSTFGVSSGKWYAEMYVITMAFSHPSLGLTGGTQTRRLLSNEGMEPNLVWYAGNSSGKLAELTMDNDVWGTYSENESSVSTISATNVVMIALDADNKKLWYGVGGTWYNSGDPAANDGNWAQSWTTNPNSIHLSFGGYVNSDQVVNFGGDSTFGGRISAGGNADGNGFGDFKYAPPSGFLALCSGNLPLSSDLDPAQTDNDYAGGKQFNVLTYNASGGDSYTGLGFKPDLVWVKWRGGSQSHGLFDSSRGTSKVLNSDNSNDEATSSGLTAFGTDGFTMGEYYNQNGRDYVAWCWRANSGVTSSNSDGDITSTVQANTKAGFSIVKWTSNNTANQDIGHGLSSAPEFIISKPYTSGSWSWHVFHHYLGSVGNFQLNGTAAFTSSTNTYGAMPTSSVFRVGQPGNLMPNNSTTDVVSYCWHSVEGYSKFGTLVGNGNADGPFIYTGFRPRLIFIKNAGSTGNWEVRDTARDTFNPLDTALMWDSATLEASDPVYYLDVLSNGFKIRTTSANYNSNGVSYIYGAWGSVPFRYNNTF